MPAEPLAERLKRLQDQLLRLYAETVELREQAEKDAKNRRLNEWPKVGRMSRRSSFDSDPSAS